MNMRMALSILAFLVPAALAGPAGAVAPREWVVSGVDGWRTTQRDSVGIWSTGEVALGLARERAGDLDAGVVWALLRDGGSVLAATGDAGELARITPDGRTAIAARVVQPQITSLGRDEEGRVLLGAAPDGMLYRLDGDAAAPVTDTPESYIWRIEPAPGGGAILATGNAGRIYRVDGAGRLTRIAETGALHVFGLARDGDGWIAATGGPARLLRADAAGAVTVLHEADEAELRAPVLRADGTIFFAGNGEDAQNPSGRVYRRAPSGAVEMVWASTDAYVYALYPAAGENLWAAVGANTGRGRLVLLEPGPPTRWREALQVPEPQVLAALVEDGAPAWVATGGLGRVHRVSGGAAPAGRVESAVHDAGQWSRWGALMLEPGASFPGVTVETRSGNTRVPDATWSAWTRVALDGGAGAVPSPPGRYLAWRLALSDPDTRIGAVRCAYLPANRAPRVNDVSVSALGATFDRSPDHGQPSALSQELGGGLRVDFFTAQGGGEAPAATDVDAAWARRFRTVTWKASDPNDDELRHTVSLARQGEAAWRDLASDLKVSPWVWDSASVPDGWYVVRVASSDATANLPAEGLSDSRVTDPFLVDNSAPAFEETSVSGSRVTGVAVDAASAVKRIEWALDGGPWTAARPDDGIADLRRESFSADLGTLAPGPHVVLLRAADRAGNLGSASVRFEAR